MQPDFPDYSGFPDYEGSPWLKNSNPAVPHQNPRFPIFTHFVASYYYLISISGLSGFSGLLKFLFCSNLPMVLSYTQKNKVSRAFLHHSNKLLLLYPFFPNCRYFTMPTDKSGLRIRIVLAKIHEFKC